MGYHWKVISVALIWYLVVICVTASLVTIGSLKSGLILSSVKMVISVQSNKAVHGSTLTPAASNCKTHQEMAPRYGLQLLIPGMILKSSLPRMPFFIYTELLMWKIKVREASNGKLFRCYFIIFVDKAYCACTKIITLWCLSTTRQEGVKQQLKIEERKLPSDHQHQWWEYNIIKFWEGRKIEIDTDL